MLSWSTLPLFLESNQLGLAGRFLNSPKGNTYLHHQLNHLRTMLPSYRNQSADLKCQLIDCFLYEGSIS